MKVQHLWSRLDFARDCVCCDHSRFCTHGKQHNKVAGSHMQLTNESVTAMPLPMPMSIGVLMQGKNPREP